MLCLSYFEYKLTTNSSHHLIPFWYHYSQTIKNIFWVHPPNTVQKRILISYTRLLINQQPIHFYVHSHSIFHDMTKRVQFFRKGQERQKMLKNAKDTKIRKIYHFWKWQQHECNYFYSIKTLITMYKQKNTVNKN